MFVPSGFEGFKVIMSGKTEAEREFQLPEVMGTNLANEVVRHFSNLTVKECWDSSKRVYACISILGILPSNTFITILSNIFHHELILCSLNKKNT